MTLTRDQLDTLKKLHEALREPLEWFVVNGDQMKHRSPHAQLNVNTSATWLVGPQHRSGIHVKKELEFLTKLAANFPALIEMAEDAIKWRELCGCVVEGQYTTLNYEDREIVMTARNK